LISKKFLSDVGNDVSKKNVKEDKIENKEHDKENIDSKYIEHDRNVHYGKFVLNEPEGGEEKNS